MCLKCYLTVLFDWMCVLQQDDNALIQLEDNSTHVVCSGDEKLRTKLRNIVMQCLKKF